ncbi:winged helix-turn-helix domain-containing protein [Pandoraea pulmonicola]|uniref:Bifunctional uroporphyrinogen-III synthetase/response regulator domain protein n=1 Tax=Pandoraea pulmonicola TaxID=93221 RepID=A0AAJ4Z8X1_PANPU|nr:winged helix-turn-helix domain-containing protein [Pandoraea pulmonicola]APD13443.1 hypothetical protein RO07_25355 [Pandoraea pulmonicola]SUA88948.1 bifunctional uroporphyrinogen-III synthetase/response regulator domain protein [Pandoraea pulmonicola]
MPMSPFDLDEVTNLVQRDGVAARLSEQEKRLLMLLWARAGTALDKRALMEALWGRRAQWMEDAALVQLVSRLRRSLAPLGLQRAIVTVARVGYRFDAPTDDERPPASSTPLPDSSPSAPSAGRSPWAAPSGDGLRKGSHDDLSDGSAIATASHDHALQHRVARDGHGEVRRHGITVHIPQIEYRLWCALHSPPGVVHDKRTLIALLWPDRPDQDDTNLMQVVSRLRRKLIPLGLHRHIVTAPRRGYRFAPCDDAPAAATRMPSTVVWLRARRFAPMAWLTSLTRRLRWWAR